MVMFINVLLFGTRGLYLFGREKENPEKAKRNEELETIINCGGNWQEVRKNIAFKILEGADPNIVAQNRKTALHEAASFEDYEGAEFLLHQGSNPNISNGQGQTPLFFVSSRYFAELLFSRGACARVVDNYGYTLLHYAMYGEPALLPLYLEKLAQENYGDVLDQVPVENFFIGKERIRPNSILHGLLPFQITPNTRNSCGEVPLHILAQEVPFFIENYEYENCCLKVQTLLGAGALLNVEDNCGRIPYDIALKKIREVWGTEDFSDAQEFLSLFYLKRNNYFLGQPKR